MSKATKPGPRTKPAKKAAANAKAGKPTAEQLRLEATLAAGGMVAANADVDPSVTEKVVARRYTGGALGDRVVVRLGADRLGPAEDLAMEFLGLRPDGESQPVAVQSRRALGFASWALITHPENAKDALALVKQIKAAGRKAKSKPGHAMELFTEMANVLNRSVRHFLPPFWEEVARIYKDLGNVTYAGRAIGKSLEAERVHALVVDRHRRRDAVLEFTLSGCLSGKALTEYTKDLEKQFEPAEAFETLSDLNVRRTLGGMPPMATAAKDIARFAKAAGLDENTEVDSFLKTIISSPAMSRASMQFWKSVKKNVARLVKSDPSFGMWLLAHTDPKSSYRDDSPVWAWLDLLDEWKVLPLLGQPTSKLPGHSEAMGDVEIPGGRAGWIGRLVTVETSPPPRVFELIELTAGVIRDEGVPIPLGRRGYYGGVLDADVLEMMLDLKLPIKDYDDHRTLSFEGWLRAEVDHPRRNSQLTHLIEHEKLGRKVYAQLADLVTFSGSVGGRHSYGRTPASQRSFEEAAADHETVRRLWWTFLDDQLKKLEEGGLVDAEEALNMLSKSAGQKTGEQFPELTSRLAKVDLIDTLQRTLEAGVFDEYGWPALDAFAAEHPLPTSSRRRSSAVSAFPYLNVLVNDQIESFGPNGRQTLGGFSIAKDQRFEFMIRVGDDAVIGLLDTSSSYEHKIAWLSDGGKLNTTKQYFYGLSIEASIPCDGGIFYGTRVLKSGDETIPTYQNWFSDGERYWAQKAHDYYWNQFDDDASNQEAKKPVLREVDPVTGKEIRESIPPWFEEDLPAGAQINWHTSHLLPAPQGLTRSPLGLADGMLGMRIIARRDGQMESRGIDGRKIVLSNDRQTGGGFDLAMAIIDKPASDSFWMLTNHDALVDVDTGRKIALLSDSVNRYCEGQPILLPRMFFHYFEVRCLKSSKKLRQIKTAQAKKLFDAGLVEHEALKVKEDPNHPDPNRTACHAAVSALLPDAPASLVKGIAKIARMAAVEKISLDKLVAKVSGAGNDGAKSNEKKTSETESMASTAAGSKASAAVQISDDAMNEALSALSVPLAAGGLSDIRRSYYQSTVNFKQIDAVTRFFRTGNVENIPKGDWLFASLIDNAAAGAWKVFWDHAHRGADEGMPVNQRLRGDWLVALRFIADCGLVDLPGRFTLFSGPAPDEAALKKLAAADKGPKEDRPAAIVEGKSRHVVYLVYSYQNSQIVSLSYNETGDPKPPKSFNIENSIPLRKIWGRSGIKHFVDEVEKVETLPLIAPEKLSEAAESLGVSPIEVALAWMGNYRSVRYGQEKLTKELREHYGWKVNEIKTAVTAANADPVSLEVSADGCRRDSKGALGKNIDRTFRSMVATWQEARKAKVILPADVIAALQTLRGGYQRLDTKLLGEFLGDPATSPVLAVSKWSFKLGRQYRSEVVEIEYTPPRSVPVERVFEVLPEAIAILNYSLPPGDPARAKLPGLIDAVRDYLNQDDVILSMGASRTEPFRDDQAIDVEGTIARFSTQVAKCQQDAGGFHTLDGGLIVGAIAPPNISLWFRPARLRTDKDHASLISAASLTFDYSGDGSTHLDMADFVREMRGEAMTQFRENNLGSKFAADAIEQDPRVSAADLVSVVAKKFKISEEAATWYLQLLALHDCSDARIKQWNGWSAAQLKKTKPELLDGGLVVTAKRSRAGRDVFLPGGWEALKLPNLPIETWKLPMFGHTNTDRLRGGYAGLIVCPRPVGEQFRVAWQRVVDGDAPKYEEAMTSNG
ncbi:DNA-binding protein [Neorhodopirellula pilleata]|uniref:Uncharacterized protein n=1 Tax=Neorhodopirellula pilleata TaxID=2714738 RepID=A0A5C6APL1_9BACT|nr:DNA-binding protein [Neorhodopirellula pilleata]TWU01630.1 hypothetical protein Pla100_13650 [Neorhodopirellula pilleata]